MRATSCNWGGWRSCMGPKHAEGMYGRSTLLESSSPKWLPMVRLKHTTTPRTRREPTRQDMITQGVKTRSFSIDDKFPSLRGVEAEVVRSRSLLNAIAFHC